MAVDFPAVIRNAAAQGVPLQEIAIFYKGLSEAERFELETFQAITDDLGDGTVIAKFPPTGLPRIPEKAESVLHLGA